MRYKLPEYLKIGLLYFTNNIHITISDMNTRTEVVRRLQVMAAAVRLELANPSITEDQRDRLQFILHAIEDYIAMLVTGNK